MGVVSRATIKVKAHAAAATHRWPARKLQTIVISGQDGGEVTAVCLAHILQRNGSKVGIITANFIEIGGERANGSDQADVLGDPFRLHGLLAQMRAASCEFAIIHLSQGMPRHHFAGIVPILAIQRRCGDVHLSEPANAARRAGWNKVLGMHPRQIVLNRDDVCYEKPQQREDTSITFGTNEKADCRVIRVAMHPQGSEVTVLIDHQTELTFVTELTGKTAIYSIVAAVSAAYLLHVSVEVIENGVQNMADSYKGLAEYLPVQRPYHVVLDTNFTPEGIDETLETLKHFTKNRLVAVVGAHLSQPASWRPIIGEVVARRADRILVTDGEYGPEESPQTVRKQLLDGIVAAGADPKAEEVAERQAALEKVISIARRNDTLVILASTKRPYRQTGNEHLTWSDAKQLEGLL
ncbi:MAG TPA: cyanophycin synthetase [Candidatus Saccharimonadales bacterium]|nr:cyanophycin synthetase [Candidatus Saccharimonadales bacterium]